LKPLAQVWIIINYNLYETKRHFSHGLGAALERRGIAVRYIDLQSTPFDRIMSDTPPDLCCSFNRSNQDEHGKFFWDERKMPYLSILVDPILYDLKLIESPYSYLSYVDGYDGDLLQCKGFGRALFWPHAVERELTAPEGQARPYDITFFGSSYDPEGLRNSWRSKYPLPMQKLIEEAIEITFSEASTPFWEAVKRLNCPLEDFMKICTLVDNYVRGIDRIELIRAVAKIPNVKVHLFGGTCWREETPIRGWNSYFGNHPQVILHPAIPYQEALQVFKQSKICLNSSPFFKRGSHERILAGLACGSLVVTNESQWTRSQFVEGEELLFYSSKQWGEVTEKVQFFLNNEPARQAAAAKGRNKVMQAHTWDHRVEGLLQFWERV
jgi:spore maturation protein CgeB